MKKLLDLVEQVRFAELDKVMKLSKTQENFLEKENNSNYIYEKQ